jgi:hypothetical protein
MDIERKSAELTIWRWKAASWAIRFYQGRGYRLVNDPQREILLRRYWSVPERQIRDSVVLGGDRWFAAHASSAAVAMMAGPMVK